MQPEVDPVYALPMAPINHDALYHRLFGHPVIVAELLREFVPAPLLDGLDLDHLDRLNTKFHAESGDWREGDMAWRIPRQGGGDAYLVLLLEFQSKSDRHMALRVLAYAALLWQQLQRERRLVPGGRLPPVLPVVVYNGDAEWLAPAGVRELIALPREQGNRISK
jgi:predicted transposase/invertase (TIGR01784 family)